MNDEVREYLNKKANDEETFKDFIRYSENYFGMKEKALFLMTLDEVKDYVNFLDDLWMK